MTHVLKPDNGRPLVLLEIQGLPGGATRVSLPLPSAEDRRRLEASIDAIRAELETRTPR
jgi:hypothetical protein